MLSDLQEGTDVPLASVRSRAGTHLSPFPLPLVLMLSRGPLVLQQLLPLIFLHPPGCDAPARTEPHRFLTHLS